MQIGFDHCALYQRPRDSFAPSRSLVGFPAFQSRTLRMTTVNHALSAALARRRSLMSELNQQGTGCYRLHGSQEGAGGLTISR
jgi:hypothetical protein